MDWDHVLLEHPPGEVAAENVGHHSTRLCAQEQLRYKTLQRFRGGLVFKAHSLVYHSTLGSRVIKKKKKTRYNQIVRQPEWCTVRRRVHTAGAQNAANNVKRPSQPSRRTRFTESVRQPATRPLDVSRSIASGQQQAQHKCRAHNDRCVQCVWSIQGGVWRRGAERGADQ